VFHFVIPPSVSPIVIVIMYHLVPTSESFKINSSLASLFVVMNYHLGYLEGSCFITANTVTTLIYVKFLSNTFIAIVD
jgi:hypothetical protein